MQYQLNLRIEMDALKSQVRHERSYREKAEADRDVQKARVKVILIYFETLFLFGSRSFCCHVLLTLRCAFRKCWL